MKKLINFFLLGLSQAAATQNSYALGVGEKASERLDLQHLFLGKDSENHLLEAGLRRGMVVLEIGCGNGVMAFWVASQVGEEGRVIAVDRSEKHIEIAKKQAFERGTSNIEFICSDVQDLELAPHSIDFVYCRFLLMHLVAPLPIVKKALFLLKEGGVFAAQEPINSSLYFYPEEDTFVARLREHLRGTAIQHGVDYDLGNRLYLLFYQAGYRPIHLHFSQRVISVHQMKDFLLRFYEDVGPAALKTGVLSQGVLLEQVRAIQEVPERDDTYFVLPQQAHVTGYKRGSSLH